MTLEKLPPAFVLPLDEADRLVREAAVPLEFEHVDLRAARGRVLAERVLAGEALPPFDASSMDGFALRAKDVAASRSDSPTTLRLLGEIPAGEAGAQGVEPGTCIRLYTGSPIPPGADAVVPFERTSWDRERVLVEKSAAPGDNIRRRGEDVKIGDVALEPGISIGAAESGLLAALGIPSVLVARRPRVAILVTGNELLSAHEPMRPGAIRNANGETLVGQVLEAGGEPIELGVAHDDRDEIVRALERARGSDVIVTSGGVSVGDHDEVKGAFERLGVERVFWRVAASPGKPVVFGRWEKTLVFGLPGNPVSSMVTFELFVRPTLRRLQSDRSPDRPRRLARLAADLRGAGDRRHFARVRVAPDGESLIATEVGTRGSGNLHSMVLANALAIVPEGKGTLSRGSVVEVILFRDGGGES